MERKKKRLSLDLKWSDWEALRRKAEAEGVGVRTVIRRGLMKELGRPVRRTIILGEIRTAYREMCGQLAKLGSNVNQIARKLNQGRELDREALGALKNIEKALAVIAVRWSPGRVLEELRSSRTEGQNEEIIEDQGEAIPV